MRRLLFMQIALWGLLWSLSHSVMAEQMFYLCASNVSAWQQQQSQLHIQLSATGTEDFAYFARQHLGHRVSLYMGDKELLSAVIQAPIESGKLVLSWPYRHRLQHLPEGPCGSP